MTMSNIKPRKEKLEILSHYMHLKSGTIYEGKFKRANRLFDKAIRMKVLNMKIAKCRQCDGLNLRGSTESAPGFGSLNSKIMLVGQSLCTSCQFTQVPFTRGCGYLIDAALILSRLSRYRVFITNAVHCHPPRNRASTPDEKKNCFPYLQMEVKIIKPKLIVAMGNEAKASVKKLVTKAKIFESKHPASFQYSNPEARRDWIIRLSNEMDKFK